MNTDLLILLGGALGALVYRWVNPTRPTLSWGTVGEVAMSAAAMLVLVASGLVPEELRAAMLSNPVRTVTFTFLASALMGAGILTLAKSVFYRMAPKNGNGATKVGLVLLAVMLAVAGCASLGYQSDSVSLPRDPLLIAYGEARGLFRVGEALVVEACADTRLDATACRVGADLRTQAVALDGLLQAALIDKRGSLSPQDLQRFLALGGQLAGLAGLAGPQLGALGALVPK